MFTPLSIIDDGLIPSQGATTANKGGSDFGATAAILQSKFLRGTLVATLGWREDRVDSFTAAAAPRGPRNNFLVDDVNWPFPSAPSLQVRGRTWSHSYVYHLPRRLVTRIPAVSSFSLRYNTSENFAPGGARFDSNGSALAAPSGETEDYGVSIGLADDRIIINATWFETAQAGVTASGIGNLTQQIVETWRLFTNMNGLGLNPGASQIVPPPQTLLDAYSFTVTGGSAAYATRPNIVLTQDFVSRGFELEAYVNLTSNWRLVFNAARQQSTRDNTGHAFRELFFTRLFNGQTLYENWTGPAAQGMFVSEGGERLANRTLNSIANPFNNQALPEGGPAQELRKGGANLVTTYSFARHTPLQGFSLGGGVRWQDRVAIGFPIMTAPTGARIIDVANPFLGPDSLTTDAWVGYERKIFRDKIRLIVKLNVFNALDDDELVPVATQPTGEVATYRIPSPRRFELSTRFEF